MTIDLDNLPSPEVFKLQDFPGINPNLIREKFAENNVEYLIQLFDWIQRSKHRAEALAQVYFNQMEVYFRLLQEIKGPTIKSTKTVPKQSASNVDFDL
jgi:hypothetical protein